MTARREINARTITLLFGDVRLLFEHTMHITISYGASVVSFLGVFLLFVCMCVVVFAVCAVLFPVFVFSKKKIQSIQT